MDAEGVAPMRGAEPRGAVGDVHAKEARISKVDYGFAARRGMVSWQQ